MTVGGEIWRSGEGRVEVWVGRGREGREVLFLIVSRSLEANLVGDDLC